MSTRRIRFICCSCPLSCLLSVMDDYHCSITGFSEVAVLQRRTCPVDFEAKLVVNTRWWIPVTFVIQIIQGRKLNHRQNNFSCLYYGRLLLLQDKPMFKCNRSVSYSQEPFLNSIRPKWTIRSITTKYFSKL